MCLILYLSIKIGHLYFKIRQGREEFRFFPSISVLLAPSTCPHHYFQASLQRLGDRHQTTRKQIFGCLIRTTGLAGGMTWPCKGLLPAALNELEVRQLHRFPGRPLKGLPGFHFIACADRLTRKRVRCLK